MISPAVLIDAAPFPGLANSEKRNKHKQLFRSVRSKLDKGSAEQECDERNQSEPGNGAERRRSTHKSRPGSTGIPHPTRVLAARNSYSHARRRPPPRGAKQGFYARSDRMRALVSSHDTPEAGLAMKWVLRARTSAITAGLSGKES